MTPSALARLRALQCRISLSFEYFILSGAPNEAVFILCHQRREGAADLGAAADRELHPGPRARDQAQPPAQRNDGRVRPTNDVIRTTETTSMMSLEFRRRRATLLVRYLSRLPSVAPLKLTFIRVFSR